MNKKSGINVIIIVFLFLLISNLFGCKQDKESHMLNNIDNLIETYPDSALRQLELINTENFSDANIKLYEFLLIKARDKCYIKHTNDSVIRELEKYYSSHRDSKRFPEVLYYRGRVASDLGDYPTTLKYFNMALNELPPHTSQKKLRGHILSQTARHLDKLQLFDEAVPYVINAIEIDRSIHDTINLVNDLQLLGGIYFRSNQLELADSILNVALPLSSKISKNLEYRTILYLASIQYYKNNVDSALIMIRNTFNYLEDSHKNTALLMGARIYRKANKPDSAYILIKRLIDSNILINQKNAYKLLLTTELKNYIPADSLIDYYQKYGDLSLKFVAENSNELSLLQHSLYNYEMHEREKYEVLDSKIKIQKITILILFLLIICLTLLILLAIKSKHTLAKLNKENEDLKKLNSKLQVRDNLISNKYEGESNISNDCSQFNKSQITDKIETIENQSLHKSNSISLAIQNQIQAQIDNLLERTKDIQKIDVRIINSEAYKELRNLLKHELVISYQSDIWARLEKVVEIVSPEFRENLELFLGKKVSGTVYHFCLLIKCGFKPTEIGHLTSRSKSTISSMRYMLRSKLGSLRFSSQILTSSELDRIIRSL